MKSISKLISKKAMISIGAFALMLPLASMAQSNIVDYTKPASSLSSDIMKLTPNVKTTSDDELKSVFNGGNKKVNSFCAETSAKTGRVVGTIYRQQSRETILLVNSGKQLVRVEQTDSNKNAKIGSTVSVPAKNCD